MFEARTIAKRQRLGLGLAVSAIHLLIAWLLIRGIGFDIAQSASEALMVFDVSEAVEPLPPEPMRPEPKVLPAAAPASAAPRSPEEAPRPIVPLPAAPAAMQVGSADQPGTGSGAGGAGAGTGGGSGAGGGLASRARLIRRELRRSDYPREARRQGAQGTVRMRIAVATNGRVSACSVTQSSGSALLDATTCRLAQRRFRYEPARDAQGRAVPDIVEDGQRWWIEAP